MCVMILWYRGVAAFGYRCYHRLATNGPVWTRHSLTRISLLEIVSILLTLCSTLPPVHSRSHKQLFHTQFVGDECVLFLWPVCQHVSD